MGRHNNYVLVRRELFAGQTGSGDISGQSVVRLRTTTCRRLLPAQDQIRTSIQQSVPATFIIECL